MRLKKAASSVIYVFLLLLMVEATGHLAYRLTQGKTFSTAELKKQRLQLLTEFEKRDQQLAARIDKKPRNDGGWRSEIVHPYFGYAVDFHERNCGTIGFCDDRIREYVQAFPNENIVTKTNDNVIVALTGGSFAYGVGNSSTPGLWESLLSAIPAFSGKKIYFYTFALGGYKQPQQLNTIAYFLGAGARFDLVINIDGFNEVALPAAENVGQRVNAYFPRNWHRRVGHSRFDGKLTRLHGERSFYQRHQAESAADFQQSWYRNSALANLLWLIATQKKTQAIRQVELRTLEYSKEDKALVSSLEARGPRFPFDDYDHIVSQTVSFWSRSSLSMHGLLAAHKIPYLHFLQPNQYLEGSKKMNTTEREIALNENHPYRNSALTGYPMLVKEGVKLAASGVKYFDLTRIFEENDEILYVDACCHLNTKGYDYIAEAVANTIRSELR